MFGIIPEADVPAGAFDFLVIGIFLRSLLLFDPPKDKGIIERVGPSNGGYWNVRLNMERKYIK